MTAESVFSVANTVALVVWVVLAIFQRRRWASTGVAVGAVGLFALAYVVILASGWMGSEGSFSSLAGVATLFNNPWLLLAGWLHYLAFDLLVGRWETLDAAQLGISPWIVVPCLALTFMFGPAGWLTYIAVRTVHSRMRAPLG